MPTEHKEKYFLQLKNHVQSISTITDADWHELLPHLQIKTLSKNKYLIKENKIATEIGFVIEGTLRQYYTNDIGEEKTTYFFFENSFTGAYISCITHKPSLISIQALSDVTYISFEYTALQACYTNSMAWQQFGRLMAEYLVIGLEERMVSLLTQSPEQRYVQLINSNKHKIIERIPQQFIANYLGITPVSMSRIRNRLAIKK